MKRKFGFDLGNDFHIDVRVELTGEEAVLVAFNRLKILFGEDKGSPMLGVPVNHPLTRILSIVFAVIAIHSITELRVHSQTLESLFFVG